MNINSNIIYYKNSIHTPNKTYSIVCFGRHLPPHNNQSLLIALSQGNLQSAMRLRYTLKNIQYTPINNLPRILHKHHNTINKYCYRYKNGIHITTSTHQNFMVKYDYINGIYINSTLQKNALLNYTTQTSIIYYDVETDNFSNLIIHQTN